MLKLILVAAGLVRGQVSFLAGTNSVPSSTVHSAAGSFFSKTTNKLYEVEAGDGSLNAVDLQYKTRTSWACELTIQSGYSFEPVSCAANQGINGGVFFDNTVNTVRPLGNNYLCFVGVLSPSDFAALDSANLQNLAYTYHATGIPVSALPLNAVFAVWNNYPQTAAPYSFVKVQITAVGFAGNVPTSLQFTSNSMVVNPLKTTLGTGYSSPKDVALTPDGSTAYVSEEATGCILRVPLGGPTANRAQASVIVCGLTKPQQLAFDHARNRLFTVEYAAAGAGRLVQVDLATALVTTLLSNLTFAVGVLGNCDWSLLYISDQSTNSVTQIALLPSLATMTVQSGLLGPVFLAWNDESSCSGLLVVERSASRVTLVTLGNMQPPVSSVLLSVAGVGTNLTSVRRVSDTLVTVAGASAIQAIVVSSFQAGDPLLLGIGLVPFSSIDPAGYADTTSAPSYLLQVKGSPFGGTLSIMLNHDGARAAGALYYTLAVDQVPFSAPFGDYLFSAAQGRFVYVQQPQLTVAAGGAPAGAFLVRQAYDLWYNHFLGYILDSTTVNEGLRNVSVQFYSSCVGFELDQQTTAGPAPASTQNSCLACFQWCETSPVCYWYVFGNFQKTYYSSNACPSPGPVFSQAVRVQIDNTAPTAGISAVYYYAAGYPGPPTLEPACAVVQGPDYGFTFNITATDPEQHLLSWALFAVWGDDKSGGIASDTYAPGHNSSSELWAGQTGLAPATGVWHAAYVNDPSSKQCAHTFILEVWDRTINGYSYIHSAWYSKSLTLLLT